MSLYNIVYGENAAADFLLGILNLTRDDVGRFRDAWVTEDGKIAIYTRNGGGNRECWNEGSPDCSCPGCVIRKKLPAHPLYLSDEDGDFDCTYATVFFCVPDEAKPLIEGLQQKRNPDEEWLKAIEALKAGKRPDVEAALKPMLEALVKASEGSK